MFYSWQPAIKPTPWNQRGPKSEGSSVLKSLWCASAMEKANQSNRIECRVPSAFQEGNILPGYVLDMYCETAGQRWVLDNYLHRGKTPWGNQWNEEIEMDILIFTFSILLVAKINVQILANGCMCGFMYLQFPQCTFAGQTIASLKK